MPAKSEGSRGRVGGLPEVCSLVRHASCRRPHSLHPILSAPFFPLQLPPSLASVQWWSARCPWGVGFPAQLLWKWPRIPSSSSSAQVSLIGPAFLLRPLCSEPLPLLCLGREGGESL